MQDLGCTVNYLMSALTAKKIEPEEYVSDKVVCLRLIDILSDWKSRAVTSGKFEVLFQEESRIEDLKIVWCSWHRNQCHKLGAFVDIVSIRMGLYISVTSVINFVKDPNQVIAVQQKVSVTVMEIDISRSELPCR